MISDDIRGDAAYLHSRGYTSKDADRLKREYGMFGISPDYAEAVCREIAHLERSE